MKNIDLIKTLVTRFDRNLDAYRSGHYNETQVRLEFIDPFFKALGWDVHNEAGIAEAYKDVVHEATVKVGGATKAPDYSFRVGGTRKFFVEAKKPSVDIAQDIHPAYQLRRYAWSAKLPLSILTDFEEFAVYDCRVKPLKTDKAAIARIMYLTFREYEERWNEITDIFSRDAVWKGDFDRFVESKRKKRGTAEVDSAFLKEIENWRELLARNIALRNPDLTVYDMNFAVQRTIDRIIFLRICEDRSIERYGLLREQLNGDRIYSKLCRLFKRADERFNSGLFHFRKEREREGVPDTLTLNLAIDDKPLKDIITYLYYPDCPYEFSVLPTEILGHVYEQFLGKVIRLTTAHRAKVEEKPEVRKAGGVYYTPTYIVDYIVKNTVGKLLEDGIATSSRGAGDKGKEVKPKDVSKMKIVDPACGSGSFLIGAYQYLLDWHRDYYIKKGPGRFKDKIQPVPGGGWRLTTTEKKRILLNNIYGVDIDPQAVEVTKLSLLLKVLEGESEETIESQLKFFHERALPDLSHNIKCGNSLIGPDFYESEQMSLLDEEEKYRINAFDWEAEFPEAFSDRKKDLQGSQNLEGRRKGGFDVVIGNPPYVRQETLGFYKEYFKQYFKVYHGTGDLYVYFIEKGFSLLKTGGQFSYIVANKWMRANYGKPLRSWLKKQCIEEIIDFGDLPVFKSATTYPCILLISRQFPRTDILSVKVKTLSFSSLKDYVVENSYPVNQPALKDSGWSLVDEKTRTLIEKLIDSGIPLGEYVDGKIYRGILTGLNKAFVIDKETKQKLIKEDPRCEEIIKPFLVGKDLKRFHPLNPDKHLIFIPKGWTNQQSDFSNQPWYWLKENYPAIAVHLAPFEREGKKRFDKGDYWWELRACEYYDEFEKPKIVYPNICRKPEFTYEEKNLYANQKCFIISVSDKYLLGILNSAVTFFLFENILPKLRGGFYEPSFIYFRNFPIRSINLSDPTDKSRHNKMVKFVDRMLDLHKQLSKTKTPHDREVLQRQIDATDRQIDQLVYELYDLTEEEIRLIEETADR